METGNSDPFFERTCKKSCLKKNPPAAGQTTPVARQPPFTSPFLGEFEFKCPPEAPTFYLTEEELEDPILFVRRIRPLGEQYGMCKIILPPSVCFPFCLKSQDFNFYTRIQHLNRIDATARNKLIFWGQIKRFWELQGIPFYFPMVEYRVLDLYTLHRIVHSEGGVGKVNKDKKWMKVATRMNLVNTKDVDHILKNNYENLVLPYILFVNSEKNKPTTVPSDAKSEKKSGDEPQSSKKTKCEPQPPKNKQATKYGRGPQPSTSKQATKYDREPQPSTSKQADVVQGSSKLMKQDVSSEDKTPKTEFKIPETEFKVPFPLTEARQSSELKKSKELKRLQFLGAGPKTPTCKRSDIDSNGKRMREERKSINKNDCVKCQNGNIDEISIQCNGCEEYYHLSCIVPPLSDIPRGKWHCSTCISKEMLKPPAESFGFEDGRKEYNLKEFEAYAHKFKVDYFKMPVDSVNPKLVEKEFWRIVDHPDTDITVEYGADINGLDHGTGFPTSTNYDSTKKFVSESYQKYCKHPWNLINLPVCKGSVFKHIDGSVSGMKIPWMYVGMCFSTFCWHNEDHWSYSINYLHWGEKKTWYCVPGNYADQFESVMKQTAPELFEAEPDILHQLCTLINPNKLMDAGIPVYKLDQGPGQFVITFPRAYHAGFNHGYNFAEAVNFAPPDWIEMGRRCIEYYAETKRSCVFSHDELLYKIAARHLTVDLPICAAAYHDLFASLYVELENREKVHNHWGKITELKINFDLIPDDERQCNFCKTTVFMSAIGCQCNAKKLVCIRHYDKLLCNKCTPKDYIMKVKFGSDRESLKMFAGIKQKVEPYETWVKRIRTVLRENIVIQGRGFTGHHQLRVLMLQAKNNQYPNTELLKDLIACIKESEECSDISNRILSVYKRRRAGIDFEDEHDPTSKPTFQEVADVLEIFQKMGISPDKEDELKEFLMDVSQWLDNCKAAIESNSSFSKEIEDIKSTGLEFGLYLPEIEELDRYAERLRWREELTRLFDCPPSLTKEILFGHKEKGLMLDYDPEIVEGIAKIDQLVARVDKWEEDASHIIIPSKRKPTPEDLENLLKEGDDIKAYLPSKEILEGILEIGENWVHKVLAANALKNGPYVDVYEDLLLQAKKINLQLNLTKQIEIQLDLVRMWKEKAAMTFLKSNSLTLMEALAPRNEIGIKQSKKKRSETHKNIVYGVKLSGDSDPGVVVAAFKKAEKYEFDLMTQLRLENALKRIDKDAKYCICRKPAAGFMMECSLCKEKFHGSCLQMGIESTKASTELADTKFLCPVCVRTKRPKLDVLFELVQSMHMIKVRIPEGEALQCLTERAMNWQDRARKLLNTDEMFTALQRLSVPLPNVPRNPEWQSKMSMLRVHQMANSDRPSTVTSGSLNSQTSTARASTSSSTSSTALSSFMTLDHGYSTVSRKLLPPKKHMRKSPLIPRVLEEPARMSESGFKQLKELMIQGDLMEVFVEESTYIWKLLQTFKPVHFAIWDEGYEEYVKHEALKAESDLKALRGETASTSLEKLFEETPPAVKKRAAMETGKKSRKILKPAKTTQKTKAVKKVKADDKKILINKKTKKSSSGQRSAKRRKMTNKNQKGKCNDDSDNDADSCEDDCAAEPCKRPTGTALHWVQCDGGCDLWFHLLCIGIAKSDIDLNEDYICDKCK